MLLRRTGRAGFHPGLDQSAGLLLRAGHRAAASAGSPGPPNQRIFADMMDEFLELASTVACGILALGADFGDRLALPRHFARSQLPFRPARPTARLEARTLAATRAAHRPTAPPARAARHPPLLSPPPL